MGSVDTTGGEENPNPMSGGDSTEPLSGEISVTPNMLALEVGGSGMVLVSGDTGEWIGLDETNNLAWSAATGLSVSNAAGLSSGQYFIDTGDLYDVEFTIGCDLDAPAEGAVEFSIRSDDQVHYTAAVSVTCGPATGTTGTTTTDPDSTGDTDDTGEPPAEVHSLYCFDEFGIDIARVDLGDAPAIDVSAHIGYVRPGGVLPGPTTPFAGGITIEDGDSGLFVVEGWDINETPATFIEHPGPNLLADVCDTDQGVLFVGETTESVLCDFAAGSCTEVVTPNPLNTCECVGSTCVAAPLLDGTGFYISTDGGQTFTEHDEAHDPNAFLGDGSGLMAMQDFLNPGLQVSTDSGVTFAPAPLPMGFSNPTPLLVSDGRIVASSTMSPDLLAVSDDSGATWSTIPSPVPNFFAPLALSTEGDIVAVGNGAFYVLSTFPDGVWEEVPDVVLPFSGRCHGS